MQAPQPPPPTPPAAATGALEEYARPAVSKVQPRSPGPGDGRLNVVVIMTDTLRPDHLACAGNTADSPQEWEARARGTLSQEAQAKIQNR